MEFELGKGEFDSKRLRGDDNNNDSSNVCFYTQFYVWNDERIIVR